MFHIGPIPDYFEEQTQGLRLHVVGLGSMVRKRANKSWNQTNLTLR